MNCPRCAEAMEAQEIGNFVVQLCQKCEGSFYSGDQLFKVESLGVQELEQSSLAATLVADQGEDLDLEALLDCPVCSEQMCRYHHLGDDSIELDECPEHGIWLDDGELGALLAFIQKDREATQAQAAAEEEIRERYQFESLRDMGKSPSAFNPLGLLLGGLNRFFTRDRN